MTPWLYHELKDLGFPVVCMDARRAADALMARPEKTDKADAQALAEMLASGWYSAVHVKTMESHRLKALLGAREQLVNVKRQLYGQVRGLLRPFGIKITHFYRQRWTIEQVFRVMKTKGFDIEAVRVAEDGPFENLATATLIAAIQVLQMVRERDGTAGRPLEDAFDPQDRAALEASCQTLEGKTEKQKNPHPEGSLAYASWVCARLGGWTGYYGKPGSIVMIQGLQSLKAMLAGWKLRKDV